jgi:transposase
MANATIERFIGLDVHKHYLVAMGVNAAQEQVFGPTRTNLLELEAWAQKHLRPTDGLVIEMTTNTWQVYEELTPFVKTVIVVHPPHVALVTRAQVMTDKIAALQLARLYAAGLLVPLWVPPLAVRELRALLAQRRLQVRWATQAKNRLHAVLQRHHLAPPAGALFAPAQNDWWQNLPVTPIEKVRMQSDLATLAFANQQNAACEKMLVQLAAQDERMPWLIQLPGVNLIVGLTVLAAIGDITRFARAEKLVGYAGLGARVHDSGLTHTTGRITKAGRRELRVALVEAAQIAANTHPYWQAELARLEPRLGRNKAIVALARKLLVVMWHVLTEKAADRHAEPERVARKLLQFTYRLGKKNRRAGERATDYVREQLDRLGVGSEVTDLPLSQTKVLHLPVSTLPRTQSEA